MSKTELSLYAFGLYLVMGVGLPFLLVPDLALGVLGLAAVEDIWVRMVGVTLLVSGGFYILAVHYGLEQLYPWTIPARFLTAIFVVVMVVLAKVGPTLLVGAAVDAIAGSLTWLAWHHESRETALTDST